MDHRNDDPCCLLEEDQELVDAAPEEFNCTTCAFRIKSEEMDPENAYAWDLFFDICSRFGADSGGMSEVVRRFTSHLPDDEFQDLWRRWNLLYSILVPPPKPAKGHD